MDDPRTLNLKRLPDLIRGLDEPYPLPPEYFVPAESEQSTYTPEGRFDANQVPVWHSAAPVYYEDAPHAQ